AAFFGRALCPCVFRAGPMIAKGYVMKNSGKQFGSIALGAALILGCSSWARSDEDADRLATAPAPVKATAKGLMGNHKLEGFDKETEGGKTIYELDYSIGGSEYAAAISESGEILETEVEVDAS